MANPKPLPPLDYIQARLNYDPDTSVMIWKYYAGASVGWNARWAGKPAGAVGPKGYHVIKLGEYGAYKRSRLAFKLMAGRDPYDQIDHRNRDRLDDRFSNLRECSNIQNRHNTDCFVSNVAGIPGVNYRPKQGWRARLLGKHLGWFKTSKEAAEAYRRESERVYGEFSTWASLG